MAKRRVDDTQDCHAVTNNVETEVLDRYGKGAQQAESSLCCPTQYEQASLDLLPREIIEKDSGCGDPSRHVHASETVVNLGSGRPLATRLSGS